MTMLIIAVLTLIATAFPMPWQLPPGKHRKRKRYRRGQRKQ